MIISKQTVYEFIKFKGTLDKYTDDFHVLDVSVIEEDIIIKCGYQSLNQPTYKRLFMDLQGFKKWDRINKLNEIL